MAYTRLKHVELDTVGGGYPYYFHQQDINEIFNRSNTIKAVQIRKAKYPKGPGGDEIFVLVGITDISNPTNPKPPMFEGDRAIVALPCPPLELDAGQYLDENGDPKTEP